MSKHIVKWYKFSLADEDWSKTPLQETSFDTANEAQRFAQEKFEGDGSTAVHEDSLGYVLKQ